MSTGLAEQLRIPALLWDQLMQGAATDDVEAAEREGEVRHG